MEKEKLLKIIREEVEKIGKEPPPPPPPPESTNTRKAHVASKEEFAKAKNDIEEKLAVAQKQVRPTITKILQEKEQVLKSARQIMAPYLNKLIGLRLPRYSDNEWKYEVVKSADINFNNDDSDIVVEVEITDKNSISLQYLSNLAMKRLSEQLDLLEVEENKTP